MEDLKNNLNHKKFKEKRKICKLILGSHNGKAI